jgi:hypothetical protein
MNSAYTKTWSVREPFKRQTTLSRRHITSLDLYQIENDKCKLVVSSAGSNVFTEHGDCAKLTEMFQSLESCMKSSNKICPLHEE